MIDEAIAGRTARSASHWDAKSGGTASAASAGTGGPHRARKSRTRASCCRSRCGAGFGTHKLICKGPSVSRRTASAQPAISDGDMSKAPHAPAAPAFATALLSDGGHAPAMGASSMGTRRPYRLQKDSYRVRGSSEFTLLPPAADQCPGDDGSLDLGRSLVDPHDPQVAHVPFQGQARAVAVAAVDLQRLVGDAAGNFGGEQLRHRCREREARPCGALARGVL